MLMDHAIGEIHEVQHAEPRKMSPALYVTNTLVFVCAVLGIAAFAAMVGWNRMPGVYEGIRRFTEARPYYPLYLMGLPLVLGPLAGLIGKRYEDFRDAGTAFLTMVTFLMCLALYPQVLAGGFQLVLPRVLGYGLLFTIDMFSLTMMLITSVVWTLVMIYAPDYMMHEFHRNRFYLFINITYGAILGTLMAGDIFTLFLFFEMMTVCSYLLVVHTETPEAEKAGDLYIYLGVMGGLLILFGMILLYINTNTFAFLPLISEMESMGWVRYLIIGLFITGFGVKAGMIPLHVWLPKAHPVAPTPASALLSGIMIKVGAYGILRVTTSFFFPKMTEIQDYTSPLWHSSHNLGAVIIWMGIATMGVGVFMALQQGHMKRMLAYHSVSQIGYVIMGIGVAVYLGYKGPMGFTGSLYHMINHALFKSLLFMVAGAVYLQTHEMDMYKLGGLWRKMPFTALVCLIAAFGITGMPLFNGFASKTMLHHAIVEAEHYGHHSFKYAEWLFTLISAGTACSFIKFFGFIFAGKMPGKYREIRSGFRMMNLAMGGMAALIIFIGLNPHFLLDRLLVPAALEVTYDPAFISKYITNIHFFTRTDLLGMVKVYFMGAAIFILGIRFHLFHLHLPHWLRFEYILLYPLYKLTYWICRSQKRRAVAAGQQQLFGNVACTIQQELVEEYAYRTTPEGDDLIQDLSTAMYAITEACENKIDRSEELIAWFVKASHIIINKYEKSDLGSGDGVIVYALLTIGILVFLTVFH
jgi:hydrogenase-4 component B